VWGTEGLSEAQGAIRWAGTCLAGRDVQVCARCGVAALASGACLLLEGAEAAEGAWWSETERRETAREPQAQAGPPAPRRAAQQGRAAAQTRRAVCPVSVGRA